MSAGNKNSLMQNKGLSTVIRMKISELRRIILRGLIISNFTLNFHFQFHSLAIFLCFLRYTKKQ